MFCKHVEDNNYVLTPCAFDNDLLSISGVRKGYHFRPMFDTTTRCFDTNAVGENCSASWLLLPVFSSLFLGAT